MEVDIEEKEMKVNYYVKTKHKDYAKGNYFELEDESYWTETSKTIDVIQPPSIKRKIKIGKSFVHLFKFEQ